MLGKISGISRVLLVGSAIGLSLAFFFPLWSIDLWAPQYPEGLGMQIWLTKVTGDLGNINLLNHYIGMHPIEPESIPELKIFIYVFGGLIAMALLASIIARRWAVHLFTALLLLFSFGALYDFYMWEYKYGHELNEDAAIKMEGESYQPPLIGKKQLANIEAWSLPATGGYGHILALLLALGASVTEYRASREQT